MSENRPWQMNREAAERLLRGDSAVPSDGHDALAGLLAAAAAPAQAGELAGESAAMTAFWEGSRSAAPRQQRRPEFRTRLARFVTVKAAAAAVALMAFGGAALAAGAGALPVTLPPSGPPQHRPPTERTSRPAIPVAPLVSPHPVGSPRPAPSATTPPALAGLCRSYLARLQKAGFRDAAGKAHRVAKEPAYAALVSAAGGEKKIIAHCRIVLGTLQPGGGQQGHWPTLPPGFPTKMPTWPTGYPSWPNERSGNHGDH
jgi:hypothetical protein